MKTAAKCTVYLKDEPKSQHLYLDLNFPLFLVMWMYCWLLTYLPFK